jgi:hypothetical protein
VRNILLNGPPRAGKDTAAAVIEEMVGAWRFGFSYPLKLATHAAYGMNLRRHDAFEKVKDDPRDEFFGITPRQAYIAHSETYMKPLHGDDVFGKIWLRVRKQSRVGVVVVPDSGFAAEAMPAITHFGAENTLLIRIHRPGHDFRGDSRSYIDLPGVQTLDLVNHDRGIFLRDIGDISRRWLAGEKVGQC